MGKCAQKPRVVALVQPDGGFVQDVHDPHQSGTDLACQPDALCFSPGKRLRTAVERQVVEPDVHQELQARLDFLDDLLGDLAALPGELHGTEMIEDGFHGSLGEGWKGRAFDVDVTRLVLQAGTVAGRTGPNGQIAGQALPDHARLGLPVAPVHVGDDAFETVSADDLVAPVVDIAEVDAFVSRAVQDGVPVRLLEPLVGHLDIESVVPRERLEHVEVVDVAPIPAPNRAFRKSRLRIGDHQVGVEVLLDAQTIARRAGARRVVEGEHARFEFADAVAAFGTRETGAEGQIRAVVGIEEADDGDVLAEVQRGLERLGEALLGVAPDPKPVHDGFDGVLLVLVEVRGMVEIGHDAVDASPDEAVGGEFREHVLVLSLAVPDHGGQDHDPQALGNRDDLVDHLADRLGIEGKAVLGAARLADPRKQEPEVVVDLGDRAHGRAGIVGSGLLLDRNRRRQALDVVDVGFLHHGQELPGVRRQRLDVAALALGVEGVEGQRGLPGAGQTRDHDELVPGDVEIDVLEVVGSCSAYRDIAQAERFGGPVVEAIGIRRLR